MLGYVCRWAISVWSYLEFSTVPWIGCRHRRVTPRIKVVGLDGERHWELSVLPKNTTQHNVLSRFLKTPATFGPVKPFLVYLYLKMEKRIRLKLLVWRELLFILYVSESALIIRFKILLWISLCENFSEPSRNTGPRARTQTAWSRDERARHRALCDFWVDIKQNVLDCLFVFFFCFFFKKLKSYWNFTRVSEGKWELNRACVTARMITLPQKILIWVRKADEAWH